jgi:hypothetical protein
MIKQFLKKIKTCTHIPEEKCIYIHNDYSDIRIIPDGSPLVIHGYCQNIDLFGDFFNKVPSYLHLDDSNIKNYIFTKYGDVSNGICLGIRIGSDFSDKKKITFNSYLKALDFYKNIGVNTDKIYVISDTANNMLGLETHYNCIEANEPDIVQFYIGMMCKNYILSESTFHLWIGIPRNT